MCRIPVLIATAFTGIVIVLSSASLLMGQGENAADLENPIEATSQSIETGKQIYDRQCGFCHGPTGKGDGPVAANLEGAKPSDLSDGTWDHGSTDGEIFVAIRDGIGPDFAMQGFEARLSEEDMWHLVNYVKSLASE